MHEFDGTDKAVATVEFEELADDLLDGVVGGGWELSINGGGKLPGLNIA